MNTNHDGETRRLLHSAFDTGRAGDPPARSLITSRLRLLALVLALGMGITGMVALVGTLFADDLGLVSASLLILSALIIGAEVLLRTNPAVVYGRSQVQSPFMVVSDPQTERSDLIRPERADEAIGLFHRGRYEEALKSVDAHLQRHGEHHEPYCTRSAILIALGRYTEALTAAMRASDFDTGDGCAMMNRSWALTGLGDYEGALEAARQAIAREPKREEGFRCLAEALEKLDQLDEAATAIQEALRLDPGNPAAEAKRAQIIRRQRG